MSRNCLGAAIAVAALLPQAAVARPTLPSDMGCPTLAQVQQAAGALRRSSTATFGIFAFGYDGGPAILGVPSLSMRVSGSFPLVIGFKLPASFSGALQSRGISCPGDSCMTLSQSPAAGIAYRADLQRWVHPYSAGPAAPAGPELDLWCRYEAFSVEGFP